MSGFDSAVSFFDKSLMYLLPLISAMIPILAESKMNAIVGVKADT